MSKIYPVNINEYPRLSQEEEREYIIQYQTSENDDKKQEACNELVYHNMGLIYSVINKVCINSKKNAEMVSYGVEGFIIALNKYDLNSDAKLTTYAYNWVYKKVIEGNRTEHMVQFPENVWDGIAKFNSVSDEYYRLNGIRPTSRPFSDDCGGKYMSDMEKALVVDAENPMTLSLYKLVIKALDQLYIGSYDVPVGFDSENKPISLDEVTEDKRISANNFQNDLSSTLNDEFIKMGKSIGKKGNEAINIFKLKLQGLSSSEIQRRLGMTRSVERTLETKGMEYLRKSTALQELMLEIC